MCLVVDVQKSDLHLINICCEVNVVKNVLWLPQAVVSYFVLHGSKTPFGVYDQSYTFAHPAIQTARWS